jgi:hypothetical protein
MRIWIWEFVFSESYAELVGVISIMCFKALKMDIITSKESMAREDRVLKRKGFPTLEEVC